MSARMLATALLLASGCRGILGIDTAIVGPADGRDEPVDGLAPDAIDNQPDARPIGDAAVPGPIAAVQGNYSDPNGAATVIVPFSLAESASDLNVVVVGWLGANVNVLSVSDTQGNPYLAVAPPTANGNVQLVIYYSTVSSGGSNTVTVQFDTSASFPDVRIAEYRGLAGLGSLDATSAATGTGTVCDSGALTTPHPDELLVGANMTTNALVLGGLGAGFSERVLSHPDQDVLSDRVVNTVGTFHATATLNISNGWIMQIAAFTAATPTQ